MFAREVSSCEDMCCFGLFILTGDASAHLKTVQRSLHGTALSNTNPEVWSTKKLIRWTQGLDEPKSSKVVMVKVADFLATSDLQKVIKYGNRLCSGGPSAAQSKIIVLSTSFGEKHLDNPDSMFSTTSFEDFERRDWLSLPEIVLRQHTIIHGVRGKWSHRVFKRFFETHRRRDGEPQEPSSWLLRWRSNEPPQAEKIKSGSQSTTMQLLDEWLDARRNMFVWTQNARRYLERKVERTHAVGNLEDWLELQFRQWTRNGSCESVLFKSGTRGVKSFNVHCKEHIAGQAAGPITW